MSKAFIFTSLVALSLILSCWLPYLNPGKWWLSGFAGLFFPIVLVINLVYLIYWLIQKKPYWGLSLGAVLLSCRALLLTFGHHPAGNAANSQSGDFTIMSFNSSSMGLKNYTEDPALQTSIYNTLQSAAPDILCIQEFYTNSAPDHTDHLGAIQEKLHYPYRYFTRDKTKWNTWQYGIVLFSKYPILSSCNIPCGHSEVGSGSSILQADIKIKEHTIRVFTAQLQSYMLRHKDYAALQGEATQAIGLAARMKNTFGKRAVQAEQLAALIKESPYPAIVCGDFNDTPVSYTYNKISPDMQDAFLQQGWGIGRTLSFLAPTLRIDYILTQSPFHVNGFSSFPHKGFEHFPIMASLSL
ncbi:endonuclease/exonuclease/phosphatase family protein [Chitinophaga sancti]|uniref:Endonuclease/exonuclease/phosphatase family protein n=1 Tax=Chitinophaga sancti TaxID=1004 RepID=A0ABZ0XAD6_9BACT|nr:endonuclease/exonuclease/phosphatase family protein [Chitinophaga sancti]WQD60558.1 endonuclease/exonuclease/phosphatase family protein [Chitinophaga sancti]WQG87314.1 endonuclease/exonuclease/phosphatase family protein [Chitinophaga sancti]